MVNVTNKTFSSFENETNTDFSNIQEVENIKKAIAKVKGELGKTYPVVINGERIETDDKIVSINPGKKSEVIGRVSKADQSLAEKSLLQSVETFESWSRVAPEERASYLFKAADIFRERRHELSATMILEGGKNYEEADAEVSEAIDFLEWYGTCMIEMENDDHNLKQVPDESNKMEYIPLGVGIIIPPWNFPLAICTGLTVSAVVAGNTVVLKPSSSSAVIAYKIFEIMEEAGLPKGVINFTPGDSGEIGDFLTGHPQTRFVSFTGSKEVGLRINEIVGKTAPGQIWIKLFNAEMGGKNGVVVDETADLDAAAKAIVSSAFSFQGQKCSAGSRLVAVESVYDELIDRVVELTKEISIGQGEDNHFTGPVVDESAFKKIMGYIEIGKEEGKLLVGGTGDDSEGYFIQPTIIKDVDPQARVMQEEIFGPVLSITKAEDYKDAINIYNNTDFGLTGAFFSQKNDRIDYATKEMHCGNLYVNRNCTGALVGVHPFGGFNLSGTDSKVGGADYLKIFSQPKIYTVKK